MRAAKDRITDSSNLTADADAMNFCGAIITDARQSKNTSPNATEAGQMTSPKNSVEILSRMYVNHFSVVINEP